jgi:hypothetical protein
MIIGPLESHVLITKLWLERANGHPLNLSFTELTQDCNQQFAIDLLQCFFAYSSTWKSISLDVEPTSLEAMSSMIESCEPCANLESAAFASLSDSDDCPLLEAPWNFFRSSPALHQVTLTPFIDSLFPPSLLTRLTSVFLPSESTITDLVLVISSCPLLEEAMTDFLFPDALAHTITITHRNLQRLLVNAPSKCKLDTVFAGFTLPSLKSLRFLHAMPQFPTFRDLLRRSKCQLEEFSSGLKGLQGDLETYIRMEELSSVTALQVSGAQVTDRVIELLLQRTGDTDGLSSKFLFLPRLKVLYLSEWKATDGMLSHFFSSRSCIPANPGHMGRYPERLLRFPTERGKLRFSFWPAPVGPVDGAFLKPNYDLI